MNTSELRKLGSENKPKIGEKFINEHDGKVYVHLENFGDVSTCEQCNFCDTPGGCNQITPICDPFGYFIHIHGLPK